MKRVVLISILLLFAWVVNSKVTEQNKRVRISPVTCYASEKTEKKYIPPPKEFLLKSANGKKSEFIITYNLFPANAKPALEYALSIWEQLLQSDVPIRIKIKWLSLGTNILARGGPVDYYSNFDNAPRKNRFYPVPVVERITRKEFNSTSVSDIEITFNKDIKWYFGTDGNTPTELYDFVTVALHEIEHGLGFTGFFFVSGDKGAYGNNQIGDIAAFDMMVTDGNDHYLVDNSFYQLATQKLYTAFTSQSLFSNSPSGKNYSSLNKIKLYAPSTWNDGSSIYHLDDSTYDTGENSLMTHAIGKGEAIHNPGPVTRGILDDIGWKTMRLRFENPKDIETLKPLIFNLQIESDNKIDSSSVKLIYSYNSFQTKDSLLFKPGAVPGWLTAVINPKNVVNKIDYFVKTEDVVKRRFLLPTEAPGEVFTVKIGTDTEAPTINHTPLPYFVLNKSSISISANIDDNLGIDTVFVEFSVNGIPYSNFGLKNDSSTIFTGDFGIPEQSLRDGDVVQYRIFAVDSSTRKNRSVSPENGFYSFKIEKIFNPVTGYLNDFNSVTNDFVLSDFNIYTAEGFKNGALQSPHPYPSPNKDNSFLNFITLLKYPVVLKDGAIMSFDEIVLVEPGEVLSKFGDDNFFDYVIAEGSKNGGQDWLPLADGYDSRSNSNWETNYNKNIVKDTSTTVGIPDWYVNRQINMLENGNFKAGDTILIRFRLYSDPYAHGWGWTIDNLRIQTPVKTDDLQLSPGNIAIYPNPFNDRLNIEISGLQKAVNLKIDIVNIYGQPVFTQSIANSPGAFIQSLNLQSLSEGLYLILVSADGKKILQQKIIRSKTKN